MLVLQEAFDHLRSLSYFPSEIPLNQKIYRFDRNGKKNAWLIAFQNQTRSGKEFVVVNFGDWKTGEEATYQTGAALDAHEKKEVSTSVVELQKKAKDEKEIAYQEASEFAATFFEKMSDNPRCDYLIYKKIKSVYSAKTFMGNDGRALAIPFYDANGKIWGYQEIYPNGEKRFGLGQKKRGNFHVIPSLESLEAAETIHLAEGFATAASIFESVQSPCVVAFDAKNLEHVAAALYEKYPDRRFIICGDDDVFTKKEDGTPWNVGRESAEKAAKRCLGIAVFPEFDQKSEKLTDFNDMFCLYGPEKIKDRLSEKKPEKHTVKCLGYINDDYYFISSEKPNVSKISLSGFSKNSLLNLMDLSYWEKRFPAKRSTFDIESAVNTLMRGGRAVGYFNLKNIRGTGVYQDQGKTVVNFGNGLWIDGKIESYAECKSKYIYERNKEIPLPLKEFATRQQMNKLDLLLHKLSWKDSLYPKLLLGWLVTSFVSGSLRWRPHIWITGASGSGKTFVMNDLILKILKDYSIKALGNSTEAGIRGDIGSNALPVVFDENEPIDQRGHARVASTTELFRQASSDTDFQVLKGTSDGKTVSYQVRFQGACSSVKPGVFLTQDINRFTILELVSDPNNGFNDEGGTREQMAEFLTSEFATQMYSRSIFLLPVIKKNFETFFKILEKRYSSRFADQYGTLLSGYMTALEDEPISENSAKELLELLDLKEQIEESETKDHFQILNEIKGFKIYDGKDTHSVAEMVLKIHNSKNMDALEDYAKKSKYLNDLLMRHGMKVKDGFFCIQDRHSELSKLFSHSDWPKGWSTSLRRIPESKKDNVWIYGSAKCTCIPLTYFDQETDLD